MSSPFSAGDTFFFKTPASPHSHLYIVLCEPSGVPPQLVAVPLNTVTLLTDNTTLLYPDDHPFITHNTAVSYDYMELFPIPLLDQLEQMNAFSFARGISMPPDIMERVVAGALTSDLATKRMVRELVARLPEGNS